MQSKEIVLADKTVIPVEVKDGNITLGGAKVAGSNFNILWRTGAIHIIDSDLT